MLSEFDSRLNMGGLMHFTFPLRSVSIISLLTLVVSCGQGPKNTNYVTSAQDNAQNNTNLNSKNESTLLNEEDEEIMGLVGQNKFMAVANTINGYYKALLKREADEGGLLHYVGLVLSGQKTLAQVKQLLESSAEATVVKLFQEILGRLVDKGARNHYTQAILAGHLNEVSLRTILLNSDEYKAKTRPTLIQKVQEIYNKILARDATQREIDSHLPSLQMGISQGQDLGAMLQGIKSGLSSTVEAAVVRVMDKILGRAPSDTERVAYLQEVNSNTQTPAENYLHSRILSQPEAQIIAIKAEIALLNAKLKKLQMQPNFKPSNYSFSKQAFTMAEKSGQGRPIYRFYNSGLDSHTYTADENEMASLIKNDWKKEGIAFREPGSTEGGVLVHRYFIPANSKHVFTTNPAEVLKSGLNVVHEGTPFRAYCAGNCVTAGRGRVLLYAFENATNYFLTPDGF